MAFLYVPAKMKRAPFTLSGDTDACFARSETVCNTRAVSKFFFWNLTNADAVVAGTAPPALREIGPFVMHKGKEKKSNVTFHGARDDRVSYVATSYAEWDESSFCEGCSLDDVVVSFNPAYYTLVHAFGSETNFLYSLTPRVVSSLVDAIAAVFLALAADPTTAAAMPHAAAAADDDTGASLRALALAQWGDCSPSAARASPRFRSPQRPSRSFPSRPSLARTPRRPRAPRWTPPPPGSPATRWRRRTPRSRRLQTPSSDFFKPQTPSSRRRWACPRRTRFS